MKNSSHLGFRIGMILAMFDLQVIPMLHTMFQVNCLSVQEKKQKIDFQDDSHACHLEFLIGMIYEFFFINSFPNS